MGFRQVFDDENKSLGMKHCECRLRKFHARALQAIPSSLRICDLELTMARFDLHNNAQIAKRIGGIQTAALAEIRSNPFGSYAFYGDNGAGKTHLAYTLYANAIKHNRRAVAYTMRELLDDFRKLELGELNRDGTVFQPRIVADNLRRADFPYTILIDEFEKARVTEFTSDALFNLLDALWKYNHQLIITTNLTSDALIARWSKIDEVYGNGIAKRIAADSTAIGLFFK